MKVISSNGERFHIFGLHGETAEVAIWIIAQYGIVLIAVAALSFQANFQVEVVLQIARIVLLEVLFVVLHLIAVDNPHFVLETLSSNETIEFLLDDLWGVFEEEFLQIVAGIVDKGVGFQFFNLIKPI